ncbi:MAG: substrate-binding domain-containing protein [Cyanobacteria bacterium P01_D01_bin.14]
MIAGSADVGMASRALKADEQHLHVFTLAQDGIAMLVHRDNPVGELSPDQIRQIYLNQINSWADVGGQSRPLTVISKTEQHATFDLFVDYFGVNPADILADIVVGDNEEMIQAVMDHPNAIGYVSIGTAEYKIVHGIPLKLLPLQGTKATIANVRNGQFPLSRPLNLVTRTLPTGLAESFINFAQSDAVNDLIEQQAFVPTTGDY